MQGYRLPHIEPYNSGAHGGTHEGAHPLPDDRTADGKSNSCGVQGAGDGPLLPRQLYRDAHRTCTS